MTGLLSSTLHCGATRKVRAAPPLGDGQIKSMHLSAPVATWSGCGSGGRPACAIRRNQSSAESSLWSRRLSIRCVRQPAVRALDRATQRTVVTLGALEDYAHSPSAPSMPGLMGTDDAICERICEPDESAKPGGRPLLSGKPRACWYAATPELNMLKRSDRLVSGLRVERARRSILRLIVMGCSIAALSSASWRRAIFRSTHGWRCRRPTH